MTIRIGNASGFYGDRFAAVREMLEGGDLDYLTGDYLAELTMLVLGRDRIKDPALGYAKSFIQQMTECMAIAKGRGVKIVTNAGGLNPAACAAKLREIAATQQLDISIAHVEGDDLAARAQEFSFGEVVTANAYLGAFGIAAALSAGADIVVTGRVTDASLVVGPAIAHFGWRREDFNQLAAAVVAGHIIECGAQASGGNFSGFSALDLRHAGFPLAEISGDGGVVITKHPGTGGAVTVDTITAQLVYEIAGDAYLGPDVTAHLGSLTLAQDGPDRVSVSSVIGTPPPATAKVCLNTIGGFRNSVEFILTGLDIEQKADLIRSQMEDAVKDSPPEIVEWQLDRTDVADPATQAAATTLLRCHVKSSSADRVGRSFTGAAVELGLASYPGFVVTRPPGPGVQYGVYRPAFVPQDQVPHRVVLADGSTFDIPPPLITAKVNPPSDLNPAAQPNPCPVSIPPQRGPASAGGKIPLGRVAFARSGDKGGDANVGVWIPVDHPRRDEAYEWLRDLLVDSFVREVLPEVRMLDLEIYPLHNLRAVNIVIRGLLGEGVSASTRFDPQAKALGEWLRARFVAVPKGLAS